MTPKALPTTYAGVTFRSRTEARWAVFFDSLGVKWEYEREGFDLPSGNYLPDFWLEDIGWFEVKGQPPTKEEERLCMELAQHSMIRTFLFPFSPTFLKSQEQSTEGGFAYFGIDAGDVDFQPCICPACGRVGIEYNGRGARVCGERCLPGDDKAYTHNHPRILEAIREVRSHRFWDPKPAEAHP